MRLIFCLEPEEADALTHPEVLSKLILDDHLLSIGARSALLSLARQRLAQRDQDPSVKQALHILEAAKRSVEPVGKSHRTNNIEKPLALPPKTIR